MESISDSEFRKAQSIALEKLRKKNLKGMLAAQREGTLQEFMRPELEAYVKRVHPGKSLPVAFQASQTSDDEISHRYSEADLTSANEVMTAATNTRKNSLPPSTKIAAAVKSSLPSEAKSSQPSEVKSPEVQQPSAESSNQTEQQSQEASSSIPSTPEAAPVIPASKTFQTSKPVSSGLAARMAALNSQNDPKILPSIAPPTRRASASGSTAQPQMKYLGSSSHSARAKRLRSDAEFGEIVNVNMYRPTILQDPTFHRKKTGSRRPSLISDSLVLAFSDENASSGQSRRKSLQSLDRDSIVECSSSLSVVVDSVEDPSTQIPFSNYESVSQTEGNASETLPPPGVDQEMSVQSPPLCQDSTLNSESKSFLSDAGADKVNHPLAETTLDDCKALDPPSQLNVLDDAEVCETTKPSLTDPMTTMPQEIAQLDGGIIIREETKIIESCVEREDKGGHENQPQNDSINSEVSNGNVFDENLQSEEVKSSQVKNEEPTQSPMHQPSASSVEISDSSSNASTQKDPEVRNDKPSSGTDPDASCHSPIHPSDSSVETTTASDSQNAKSTCSCCTIS